MQLYIQHLLLDRMPKAAFLLAKNAPIPTVADDGPYQPRNDLDSVIALILRVNFKEHYDFLFRQFIILI
jgi:hypothetical protein